MAIVEMPLRSGHHLDACVISLAQHGIFQVQSHHLIFFKMTFSKIFIQRAPTEFWCAPPKSIEEIKTFNPEVWKNYTGTFNDSCYVPNIQWESVLENLEQNISLDLTGTELTKCERFIYDKSFWKRTVIQVRKINNFELRAKKSSLVLIAPIIPGI